MFFLFLYPMSIVIYNPINTKYWILFSWNVDVIWIYHNNSTLHKTNDYYKYVFICIQIIKLFILFNLYHIIEFGREKSYYIHPKKYTSPTFKVYFRAHIKLYREVPHHWPPTAWKSSEDHFWPGNCLCAFVCFSISGLYIKAIVES